MQWAQDGTAVAAGFLASFVEFVEALTIVLAVGVTRGWRSALLGVVAGVSFLLVLTALLGSTLQRIPVEHVQLVVGVLLLLFGMRWLRKAMLRSAGVIALHDEARIFERERAELGAVPASRSDIDVMAFVTSFKAVVLEGLEVIFIVIATGAGGHMASSALGAAVAGALVVLAGVFLHRPLARVPENTLKYAVGVLLSAFGVFWTGEGLGYAWPAGDVALPVLAIGFLVASEVGVMAARRVAAR